jgi:hypothetical protein
MLVRIRLGKGSRLLRSRGKSRRTALAVSALLTPSSAIAAVLGMWRLAADLNWANRFAVPSGIFSHWQVWLGAAFLLQLCSHLLNRYGRGGDAAIS